MADFGRSDHDTGEWLLSLESFEFSPFESRALSTMFFFLLSSRADYFLLSFMCGNLTDWYEADTAPSIVAEYLAKDPRSLANRFSREEMRLFIAYFAMIEEFRGLRLEEEAKASNSLESALLLTDCGPANLTD